MPTRESQGLLAVGCFRLLVRFVLFRLLLVVLLVGGPARHADWQLFAGLVAREIVEVGPPLAQLLGVGRTDVHDAAAETMGQLAHDPGG